MRTDQGVLSYLRTRYVVRLSACLLASACSFASAQLTNVGTITIDVNKARPWEIQNVGGGATTIAHFAPNAVFDQKACCPRENIRWIQTYFADPRVNGVSPFPNRTIIDPRKDQNVPGAPNNKGDDKPFYDLTYPTQDDAQNNTNLMQGGNGAYYQDTPRVAPGQTDVTVRLTTALVCFKNDDPMRLCMLGGFRWGFKVDSNHKVSLLPVDKMSEAEVRNNPFSSFNAALRQDFPGYSIVNQYKCGCLVYFNVAGVPEPGSALVLVCGVLSLLARQRRTAKSLDVHR